MKTQQFMIGQIPAVLYGEHAEQLWLFLHGQMGHKEEAEAFAKTVCPKGAQVLGIDLPGHGARQGRDEALNPWTVVPELQVVMDWARVRWDSISLRANSIGAYFAMLTLDAPDKALLVSPILDMERLILDIVFNPTIHNFINFLLSKLKRNSPEEYAAALYQFYNDERLVEKLIVNPTSLERPFYQKYDPCVVSYLPRELPDGTFAIAQEHTTNSLQMLLKADFMTALNAGHNIRRCIVCKKYFLVRSGVHALYCEGRCPLDERFTCRQYGSYEIQKELARDVPKTKHGGLSDYAKETLSELESVGKLALVECIRTGNYKTEKGRFTTYVTPFLDGAMRRHLERSMGTLALDRDSMGLVRKAQHLYYQEGKEPSEVCASLGISFCAVARAIA